RWQRRWFVLYDDGELTYSVDEHEKTAVRGMASPLSWKNKDDAFGRDSEITESSTVSGDMWAPPLPSCSTCSLAIGLSKEISRRLGRCALN
ncbi:Protein outspread, partial [Vespula squamosa]